MKVRSQTLSAASAPLLGVVSALAIDPITPTTLYAGTDSGGVFKSTDAGGTWSGASTGLPVNSTIWTLAIDPTTPNTLYAGTYAGNIGNVFKTTDGGASWSTFGTGLIDVNVRAIAIDPLTPTTVYAATDAGGLFDIEQEATTATGTPTPTSTPHNRFIPTLTPTPSTTPVPCVGDCNNDQAVTIDELLTLVNIALGSAAFPASCPGGVPASATVDVSLVITAANHAISGCGG